MEDGSPNPLITSCQSFLLMTSTKPPRAMTRLNNSNKSNTCLAIIGRRLIGEPAIRTFRKMHFSCLYLKHTHTHGSLIDFIPTYFTRKAGDRGQVNQVWHIFKAKLGNSLDNYLSFWNSIGIGGPVVNCGSLLMMNAKTCDRCGWIDRKTQRRKWFPSFITFDYLGYGILFRM